MSGYILPGQAFKQGEVKSGKYDLVYASAGEGPVIVSFPGSAGMEMSVAKDILAREFRVIEINPPGWAGRTDLKEKMDQRDLADLLAEAIAALGIDRYHLLGTSMGGINAVWLTLRHPDRVKSLVLDASMTFMAPEHSTDPAGTGFIEALRAGQFSQQQIEGRNSTLCRAASTICRAAARKNSPASSPGLSARWNRKPDRARSKVNTIARVHRHRQRNRMARATRGRCSNPCWFDF